MPRVKQNSFAKDFSHLTFCYYSEFTEKKLRPRKVNNWPKWKWKSHLTLCNPLDCSLLGSPVCGIFQARILEWVAIPFSRESSQPSYRTGVSCIASRLFTSWAMQESLAKGYPITKATLLLSNVSRIQSHAIWFTTHMELSVRKPTQEPMPKRKRFYPK